MAVYNCRDEAGLQRKVKPVGSGRVRAFVQQKERLLPINLGLYFLSLIILFYSSPCTSCPAAGTKKNLQKCDVFVAALECSLASNVGVTGQV